MIKKNALWIIPIILLATIIIPQQTANASPITAFGVNPQVTDITRPGGPIPIGGTFSINLTVADVTKLWGYQYWLAYNTSVLAVTDKASYAPFTYPAPSETSDFTYLNVDPNRGYNHTVEEWNVNGESPYLFKSDYPTNYISTTVDGKKIGNFTFSLGGFKYAGENLGGKVQIEINATGDGDDYVEIWLFNGTAMNLVSTITPDATFDWKSSVDVGPILNTTAKINNVKLYLVKRTTGTEGEIIVDAMRLKLYTGYVSAAFTSFNGDPNGLTVAAGASPVTIGTVYFEVKANGTTKLDLVNSKLADVKGYTISSSLGTMVEVDGYFSNTEEIQIHDVAITDMTASPTTATIGDKISIGVTVKNVGVFTENFTVSADYDGKPIGDNKTITNLLPDQTQNLNFTWSTTGVAQGTYTLSTRIRSTTDNNPANNIKSTTVTLKSATGEFNFTNVIYILAGIIIIVVVIGVIYALRKRK